MDIIDITNNDSSKITKKDIENYIINVNPNNINNNFQNEPNILFFILSHYKFFTKKFYKIVIDKGINLLEENINGENILVFAMIQKLNIDIINYFYKKNKDLIKNIDINFHKIYRSIFYENDYFIDIFIFFNKTNCINKIDNKCYILKELLNFNKKKYKNSLIFDDICEKLFLENIHLCHCFNLSFYQLARSIIRCDNINFVKNILCKNNLLNDDEKRDLYFDFLYNSFFILTHKEEVFNIKIFSLLNDYDFNIFDKNISDNIKQIIIFNGIYYKCEEIFKKLDCFINEMSYTESKKL